MFQEISIANRARINLHRQYSAYSKLQYDSMDCHCTLTPQSEIVHVTRSLGTVLVLQCVGACGTGSTRFFRCPFEI